MTMKKIVTLLLSLLVLLAVFAPAALAADEITVYVNVVENGALFVGEKSGEPIVALPVTVKRDATVNDVLRALHEAECSSGAAGYVSMDWYGSTYMSKWFGRTLDNTDGSIGVTAWKNHDANSTTGSKVRDGDVVDVCVYTWVSAQNFTFNYYGQAWMDYYAVEAGVNETFTVGAWRSSMDMMTWQYNTEACSNMPVSVNGSRSNFRVQDNGDLELSFSEPGVYYVCVGGDTAYGAAVMKVTVSEGASFTGHTFKGPSRMAASGLEDAEGGAPITVYATVTDMGGYFKSEADGANLIAVPVTVPTGATLDDVLNALHAQHCSDGETGYASASMEMYGTESYYITKWFGDNVDGSTGVTRLASAWVNNDLSSTLATPVADGDFIYASLYGYSTGSDYSFSYEYYGIGYFDHAMAEAAPGETVTLHPYTETANMMSMTGGSRTTPLTNMSVYVNGELNDARVDSTGELKISFDQPGVYDILAVSDKTHPAAAMKLTVKEGAAFNSAAGSVDISDVLKGNLSAPGNGTGDPVTVYVTVSDNGGYAKSETDGEYMIAVPVTVPGGSTVDDVLQKFNDMESAAGAMGYTSSQFDMWGSTMYSIGAWFGKPSVAYDGSNYAVIAWRNRNTMSTLAEKVSEGDIIEVNIYGVKNSTSLEYSYWGLGYFDFCNLTAGVNDEITLKAYHASMDAASFQWVTYVSTNLTVYVNGEKVSETVGNDGTLKLKFDKPGTYYVLAEPADDSYGAASAKIVVEEGASFADNTPDTVVDNARAPVSKLNFGPILKYLVIAVIVVIVVISVVRAVKKSRNQKDNENGEE